MVTVCRKLSAASWLWPLQEETSAKRRDARRFPRQACQRRWSCARVGGAATKAAGMMPEHSPVPPEACRGARVDDQRRTVPTSRRGRQKSFRFGRFCTYPKWKSPRTSASGGPAGRRTGDGIANRRRQSRAEGDCARDCRRGFLKECSVRPPAGPSVCTSCRPLAAPSATP